MFHVSPLLFPASLVHFFFTWRGLCLDFAAFDAALPWSILCSYSRGKVCNVMLFKWFAFYFIVGSSTEVSLSLDHDSRGVVRAGSTEEILNSLIATQELCFIICKQSRLFTHWTLQTQQYNETPVLFTEVTCAFQRNTHD